MSTDNTKIIITTGIWNMQIQAAESAKPVCLRVKLWKDGELIADFLSRNRTQLQKRLQKLTANRQLSIQLVNQYWKKIFPNAEGGSKCLKKSKSEK